MELFGVYSFSCLSSSSLAGICSSYGFNCFFISKEDFFFAAFSIVFVALGVIDLGSSAARAALLFSIILGVFNVVLLDKPVDLTDSTRMFDGLINVELPSLLPPSEGKGMRGVNDTPVVAVFFFFFFFDVAPDFFEPRAEILVELFYCSWRELLRE